MHYYRESWRDIQRRIIAPKLLFVQPFGQREIAAGAVVDSPDGRTFFEALEIFANLPVGPLIGDFLRILS